LEEILKKKILNIEGMTCSACSNGLEKYLNRQKGIKDARVNLVMAQAEIEYDENVVGSNDLDRFVKEAGFKSLGEKTKDGTDKFSLLFIIQFSILAIILMITSMGKMVGIEVPYVVNMMDNPVGFTIFELVIAIFFLVWGADIIINGIKNLLHRMPNMDTLVGVGVTVNFIYSLYNSVKIFNGNHQLVSNLYFESCAMIILFIKIGRYIDKRNKAKAVDSIKGLVTITPKSGTVVRNSKKITVTINEISKGDIVCSKPGERISVDGIVTKGETHTDESFITGESKPVSKKVGSRVLAGSINYDGYIEYSAENIGKDSSISHIVDMVVEATNTKAPISRLADKISGYFVPVIFAISIFSFILNIVITKDLSQALTALVSVLVVACPCALGLATPLAMVVSIGNATKRGIVIKSSETIEALNGIDTILMDKTGTITKGKLEVVDRKFVDDENTKKYYNLLQSLEKNSNHPLAKSICNNKENVFEVNNFEEIVGQGITGTIDNIKYYAGNRKLVDSLKIINNFENEEREYTAKGESIVYFMTENKLLGIIGLRDEIKEDSKNTIEKLKNMGKRVVMLSGDNEITASVIAKEVGISEVYSNISPQGKLDIVRKLNKNNNCLMVGDGINDSPALKEATVGISVSNGTDISSDSSDIMFLNDNMENICELFNIGHKTIKIIRQNLYWALGYNLLMVPLATGLLPIKINPMIASLAMTLSSLTVVLNSLRLRK